MIPKILIDRPSLLDLVHDRWFDLNAFQFDQEKHEICLYLGERRKGPYDEKLLKVTDVLDVAFRDEAQIQIYDLADVQITPSSIRLVSGFPLEIVLTIGEQCEISLSVNPSKVQKEIRSESLRAS